MDGAGMAEIVLVTPLKLMLDGIKRCMTAMMLVTWDTLLSLAIIRTNILGWISTPPTGCTVAARPIAARPAFHFSLASVKFGKNSGEYFFPVYV